MQPDRAEERPLSDFLGPGIDSGHSIVAQCGRDPKRTAWATSLSPSTSSNCTGAAPGEGLERDGK